MSFVVGLALGLALTPALAWMGERVGFVDDPSDPSLQLHTRAIPTTGGIAVVLAMIASAAVFDAGAAAKLAAPVGVCLAVGSIDDRSPLPAWLRAGVVAGAGALGWAIIPPLNASGAFGAIVTILLVLVCANATNILDGQDGLAAGVACVAALGLAFLEAAAGRSGAAITALGLAGALGGFLAWNRPPARVFLGNGGAYATGGALGLGAATVVLQGGPIGVASAGLCLGVFAFEIVFTIARRVVVGAPMSAGDREHSYDILAARIGRNRATVAFIAAGGAAAGAGALAETSGEAALILLAAGGALGVGAGLSLWRRRPSAST